MKTLIKNGLLIDPANQVQAYLNLILEDGKVVAVTEEEPEADRVIDALLPIPEAERDAGRAYQC